MCGGYHALGNVAFNDQGLTEYKYGQTSVWCEITCGRVAQALGHHLPWQREHVSNESNRWFAMSYCRATNCKAR